MSGLDDPIAGGAFGETALIAAVRRKDRDEIQRLIAAGANPNQKSHWWAGGFHPLDSALEDPDLFEHLVAGGAVPDIHHLAALDRREQVDRLLREQPALVQARGGDGQLPLHFARTAAMADLLLSRGAEIDARDVDHESTAVQWMIRDRTEVARHLVARGAAADLLAASALGDFDRVSGQVARDPDVVRLDVSERSFPKQDPRAGGTIYIWTLGWFETPHSVARRFGHDRIYRWLLERTPSTLAFALAASVGDEREVHRLLSETPGLAAGLSPDDARRLVHAAARERIDAVRVMLDAGWPPAVSDAGKVTALHWAAFHGHADMTALLIARGAPTDVRDNDFQATPLGWAVFGSRHGWHPDRGDYGGVVSALLTAGPVPDGEPEGSEAVRDAWGRWRASRAS